MVAVIDTNIFVVSLTSRSPYHKIYTSLVEGNYGLAVSNEILLEYAEVLTKKYSPRVAHEFLNLLVELPNVQFVNIHYNWKLIAVDKDDNKFIDCAVAASANCIVTEDNHFNILKSITFPKVNIIGIHQFMTQL